jgi:hypothetical protein
MGQIDREVLLDLGDGNIVDGRGAAAPPAEEELNVEIRLQWPGEDLDAAHILVEEGMRNRLAALREAAMGEIAREPRGRAPPQPE